MTPANEIFVAAHRITKGHRAAGLTYRDLFASTMRFLYKMVRGRPDRMVAVRALARGDVARIVRQENLLVSEIHGGVAQVYNPMTDQTYTTQIVTRGERGGFHCTCPDHKYRAKQVGPCKHVAALASAVIFRK